MQPCVEKGEATLAVCKPCVRKIARAGDVVVAYRSPPGHHKLRQNPEIAFAGVVDRVTPMEDYMGGHRRDSRIYGPGKTRTYLLSAYDAQHWNWNGLSEQAVIQRDWSGKNVLHFSDFFHAKRQPNLPPWLAAIAAEPAFKAGDRGRRGFRISELPA